MAESTKQVIPTDVLRSLLDYSPSTGTFVWKVTRSSRTRAGMIAGTTDKQRGYVIICIGGVLFSAHRLAWQYVHGEPPAGWIDHINLNCSDNRLENLRVVDACQNGWNAKARRSSSAPYKGITKRKDCDRWQALLKFRGKVVHLGLFETPEEAHAAYCEGARKYFGEFARFA